MIRSASWVIAVLLTLLVLPAGAQEGDWEFAKRRDGVEVYTRDVSGSAVKEFRATSTVPAPLAEVVSWYTDPTTYTQWIDSCVEAHRVGEASDTAYFKFNFPFPATDRDVVLRARTVEESPSAVVFEGQNVEGLVPEVDGLVRIQAIRSRWEFRAKGEAETEVVYRQHMDAGGSLPGFILNRAAVDNPIGTLRGLARYAEANRSSQTGE
jgi:hypothetical protein